jgi:very-long-chain ceramide synthase
MDPNEEVCFTPTIRYAFFGLLLALQVLLLIWFGMILRIAYSVVMGKAAEDSRSDDEADEEEVDEEIEIEVPAYEVLGEVDKPSVHVMDGHGFQEEEVGADGLYQVKKRNGPVTRSRGRISGTRASGISIPGHGDHKELLGRIGCDKPS